MLSEEYRKMRTPAEDVKSSGPRLILPKIIYKQSQGRVVQTRVRQPQTHLHDIINEIIGKVNGLYRRDSDQFALKEVVKDLVVLSAECRKNQNLLLTSSKSDDNVRFMKLKVRSMEADLQLRRQQIMRLQEKIKQLGNQPSYKSRLKGQLQGCRSQDIFPFGLNLTNSDINERQQHVGVVSDYGFEKLLLKKAARQNNQENAQLKPNRPIRSPNKRIKSPSQALKSKANSVAEMSHCKNQQQKEDELRKLSKEKNKQIQQLQAELADIKLQHSKAVNELEGKYKRAKKLSHIYKKECQDLTQKAIYSELCQHRSGSLLM